MCQVKWTAKDGAKCETAVGGASDSECYRNILCPSLSSQTPHYGCLTGETEVRKITDY
jgi:hypothetical protein